MWIILCSTPPGSNNAKQTLTIKSHTSLFYFSIFAEMKRILFLFLFCFSLFCSNAQEHRFSAGITAGLSSSQISGDELAGFNKTGFTGGLLLRTTFTKNWTTQFEMLFIQKGSKEAARMDSITGEYSYYRLQLNYLEVPVLLQYRIKKVFFEAGPGIGYLINYREEDKTGDITNRRPFNKFEISFNFGFGVCIKDHFGIGIRYSNSINSVRDHLSQAKRWYNPGQQNTALQLALSYTFGNTKQDVKTE